MEDKKKLKDIYGFEFPEDFWSFYEFYQEIKGTSNQKTLEDFEGLCLFPTGPFDVLSGRLNEKKYKLPITHHMRFRMDPPEFHTILLGRDDGLHYGYWIDDVRECEFFIAGYYNNDAYQIDYYGKNLLEFIRYQLEDMVSGCMEDVQQRDDEEVKHTKKVLRRLASLRNVLMKYCTGDRLLKGEEYCVCYAEGNERQFTAPTWEGIGIVVPDNTYQSWHEEYFDGLYRPTEFREELYFEKVNRLCEQAENFIEQKLYGNALQIGKNLWSLGMRYSEQATLIMEKAYCGLGRKNYAEIIQLHQRYRERPNANIDE